MTYVLILFFISLAGIAIMLGRRVSLIRNGKITIEHDASPLVPPAHEVKYVIVQNLKKGILILTAIILRISIRSSIYAKTAGTYIAKKIHERFTRHSANNPEVKKGVSSFLKIVSEYKHKLKTLKKKIKEEEKQY